jgi:hypothetical protein
MCFAWKLSGHLTNIANSPHSHHQTVRIDGQRSSIYNTELPRQSSFDTLLVPGTTCPPHRLEQQRSMSQAKWDGLGSGFPCCGVCLVSRTGRVAFPFSARDVISLGTYSKSTSITLGRHHLFTTPNATVTIVMRCTDHNSP